MPAPIVSRTIHIGLLPLALILSLLMLLIGTGQVVAVQAALVADLTGEAEVDAEGNPDQGDLDGEGVAFVFVDSEAGELCYLIEVSGIAAATAAHIHEGAAGVVGDVVVPLAAPNAEGFVEDCITGLDAALLEAIAANPAGYYVNVHNAEFPDGALRGQLAVAEAECELFASTEDDEGGATLTATVGEEVLVEGFFVGGADVDFTLFLGEEEIDTLTVGAEADGYASFGVVFEAADIGTWTILGTVEGTECAASVEITVVAGAVAPTPVPPAPTATPAPAASLLPDTTMAIGSQMPASGVTSALFVLGAAAMLVAGAALVVRRR